MKKTALLLVIALTLALMPHTALAATSGKSACQYVLVQEYVTGALSLHRRVSVQPGAASQLLFHPKGG